MRTDTATFSAVNLALQKEPRYVVEIAFDSANTVLRYFTSHDDAALPSGATAFARVVQGLSGTSQTLKPDEANATIGNISFRLVDRAGAITLALGGQLQLGRSTRLQRVRVYVGFVGLAWADYTLVQTQLVQDVAYSKGAYVFRCLDVQREMRTQIFDIQKTTLTASALAADTTINVVSTSLFQMVAHGTSYTDAPSSTVGYIRIEDEIVRYTGSTSTTFTGCTRGALNTVAADHLVDSSASTDRQLEVDEYVYLEMPALKLMYAVLTGVLFGQGGATLPDGWHLGIPTQYVRLSDFTDARKSDLWNTADDTAGFITLFQDLEKTDGKKFVETELALLCGVFMPVYTTGELGCKRMANILTGAAAVAILDQGNIADHDDLLHDFQAVKNVLTIHWNWDPLAKDFTRENDLIDLGSLAIYQKADPLELSFRGLHGSRHSAAMLSGRFDALRDRYSGPPLRLSITVLWRFNALEVGDVVRVRLPSVRDYPASGAAVATLDRSFEIENISVDWITGELKLDLMATSRPADAAPATSDATVLSSAWRTGTGTALSSVLTTSGSGPVHVTANGTLAGNADMNAAGAIYYVDDDLQIDAGVTIRISGNVQIRCKFFQNNGVIDGKGAGLAGGAALISPASSSDYAPGTLGGIGSTEAGGGLSVLSLSGFSFFTVLGGFAKVGADIAGGRVASPNSVVPVFTLNWDPTVPVLRGIPGDLRGTSGSSGMPFTLATPGQSFAPGGAGGNGGAGLAVVCRGFAQGASARIDLSGGDGALGSTRQELSSGQLVYAGSGAGGAPGGLLVLLDGSAVTATDINDAKFIARNGKTPIPASSGTFDDWRNALGALNIRSSFVGTGDGTLFALPDLSGVRGGCRVQYVPGASQAVADLQALQDRAQREDLIAGNFVQSSIAVVNRFDGVVWAASLGLFVAVGGIGSSSSIIYTSGNGADWTSRTSPKTFELNDIAFDGTTLVAVGNADGGDGYIVTSTDGTTWTERANAKNVSLRSIVFANGLFVAVGNADGGDAYIVTSPTGTTWTERANPKNVTLSAVTWTGVNFVAVGLFDSGTSQAYVITSPDGITWTQRTVPTQGTTSDVLSFVAFSSSKSMDRPLIAAGQALGGANAGVYIIASSDNGLTWARRTPAASLVVPGNILDSLMATDSLFVAIRAGKPYTSFDGANWNPKNTGTAELTHDMVFNDHYFVAVGENSAGSSLRTAVSLTI